MLDQGSPFYLWWEQFDPRWLVLAVAVARPAECCSAPARARRRAAEPATIAIDRA